MWAPYQDDFTVDKKTIEDAWSDCIAIVVGHFECSSSDLVKVTIICDICSALSLQVRIALTFLSAIVLCAYHTI